MNGTTIYFSDNKTQLFMNSQSQSHSEKSSGLAPFPMTQPILKNISQQRPNYLSQVFEPIPERRVENTERKRKIILVDKPLEKKRKIEHIQEPIIINSSDSVSEKSFSVNPPQDADDMFQDNSINNFNSIFQKSLVSPAESNNTPKKKRRVKKNGELLQQILSHFKPEARLIAKDVQTALGVQVLCTSVMGALKLLTDQGRLLREKVNHNYQYWLNPDYVPSLNGTQSTFFSNQNPNDGTEFHYPLNNNNSNTQYSNNFNYYPLQNNLPKHAGKNNNNFQNVTSHPSKQYNGLSPGELRPLVLSQFKLGERYTVKTLHETLGRRASYDAVSCHLRRLMENGILGREKVGSSYEYRLKEPSLTNGIQNFNNQPPSHNDLSVRGVNKITRTREELESAVLSVFKPNIRMDGREVQIALGEEYNYSVLTSALERLVVKWKLKRQKVGKINQYWLNPDCNLSSLNLGQRIISSVQNLNNGIQFNHSANNNNNNNTFQNNLPKQAGLNNSIQNGIQTDNIQNLFSDNDIQFPFPSFLDESELWLQSSVSSPSLDCENQNELWDDDQLQLF